jgi:8-oxo-dGTP pyrophosphatase MutT (NUDIX family)
VESSLFPDPGREALRSALLRHVPADDHEAADLVAILSLVETEPACFARSTFAPGHVTGSAFIVHAPSRRVLLHHHRRLRAWLQMGGHDEGESDPRATALREGAEESGLADLVLLSPSILDVDVHAIPAGKGEPPHLHHDVRYALATLTPDAIRRDEAESVDLRWFGFEEAAGAMGEPDAARALARIARLLDGPRG